MKYLAILVERLQDEANRQQEHIEEMFNDMEIHGLHNVLKKHFVRDNGVIRPRRGVEFNLPQKYKKKYSLYRRRSSPYPPLSHSKTSSSTILPKNEPTTINQPIRTITMDWITYQGGMGSRFNPIIIEDD